MNDTQKMKLFGPLLLKLENQFLKHSQVGSTPFFENSLFPWVSILEQNIVIMQQEMSVILARLNDLPNFQDISLEQKILHSDFKWKVFPFFAYGVHNQDLEDECPNTMSIIKKIPGIKTAMYSILLPHIHIPAHRGPYRGLLRLHIPLKIPANYQNCKIEVNNQIRCWEGNKCLIFDDGFIHQVWNNTEEIRVVLFIDFLRPLGFPWHQVNNLVIKCFSNTSFIQESSKNADKWYKEKWSGGRQN